MDACKKIVLLFVVLLPLSVSAQEKPQKWDLSTCVDYALAQNIQIKKSKILLEESKVDLKKAKAQLFPSLSISSGHSLANTPYPVNNEIDKTNYTGNYSLRSSLKLYEGGKRYSTIKQQMLQNQVAVYDIMQAEDDIELAITEIYFQILYANESVKINRATYEVSVAQLERAKMLLDAGSISKSDYAQMESQCSTDKYQIVVAENSLSDMKLQLKQLLELDISDEMDVVIPDMESADVLVLLPPKEEVYGLALSFMPQIKSSKLNVDISNWEVSKARSGYLPSLSLDASIGTGSISGTNFSFSSQLKNNLNESIGLTLSIPIFSNRETKSAVQKARLGIETSKLNYLDQEKGLLKTIEDIYLEAVSSQNRYQAALEQIRATQMSYDLITEQYNLGMKNTLELLTEKNNLLNAKQELLQAKYMTLLNIQLLNFYQNKPIEI